MNLAKKIALLGATGIATVVMGCTPAKSIKPITVAERDNVAYEECIIDYDERNSKRKITPLPAELIQTLRQIGVKPEQIHVSYSDLINDAKNACTPIPQRFYK